MNRKGYNGDPRYAKVLEKMDLLGIMDVSTTRQSKNGTIVWKLPIKNQWKNGKLIEVASFATGYVRNQNSCYSNYQLNKCKPYTEYFKDYRYTERGTQEFTGKYRKYTGKQRILIPIEIDRLEYLISYCLKNYYIKNANLVANGDFVAKWEHEYEMKNGSLDRVRELQSENRDLEAELEKEKETYDMLAKDYDIMRKSAQKSGALNNLSVTVNGERYKII